MRARRGFTLVEVLIAAAVLAVGLVGIMSLLPVGLQAGREGVDRQVAANIGLSLDESLDLAFARVLRDGENQYVLFAYEVPAGAPPARIDLPGPGQILSYPGPDTVQSCAMDAVSRARDLECPAGDPAADFSFRLSITRREGPAGPADLFEIAILLFRHYRPGVSALPFQQLTTLKAGLPGGGG